MVPVIPTVGRTGVNQGVLIGSGSIQVVEARCDVCRRMALDSRFPPPSGRH